MIKPISKTVKTILNEARTPAWARAVPCLLRGGRMTKVAGRAASYAPMMGISALALGAVLAGDAEAGSCTKVGADTWECSGAADSSTDTSQTFGGNLIFSSPSIAVTSTQDFGVDTSANGGHAVGLYVNGSDLTFEGGSGPLIGAAAGIYARNSGTGMTTITTSGPVQGGDGLQNGIDARNDGATTGLTISAADVTGSFNGLYAKNYGTGATEITTTGTVEGTGFNGIFVTNGTYASELTITAEDVSGYGEGIVAHNDGTGATTITASGTVTGETYSGIFARNGGYGYPSGTDLTITAEDVSGYREGIFAKNYGSGAITITANGTVTSEADAGIYAQNGDFGYSAGTDLTISTADVSGYLEGIYTKNYGSGATTITATGTVTGEKGDGIAALNSSGTDLTIKAAAVSGGDDGIAAKNLGTGATTITATVSVYGDRFGINAANGEDTSDLTIDAAEVTGNGTGIKAYNTGSGATSVTVSGPVSGMGNWEDTGRGIFAHNGETATSLVVKTEGDVYGKLLGIGVANRGTGATTIIASGMNRPGFTGDL